MTDATRPSVTVVIATRHRPELLAKAVDAALAQRYDGPIEVFAVFDQADPQFDLAREYGDAGGYRRVRVVPNDRTPGLPGARNTGITAGEGELVAFCDDDDAWRPDKLEKQVAAMQRLGCKASATAVEIAYGDDVKIRTIGKDRLDVYDLARDRTTAHPSSFVADRRFVIDEAGLVDEEIPGGYGEDYDWLMRVARLTDVAIVDEPLVDILWHPGSFFTRRWDTIVEALQYMIDKHPEIRADPKGMARIEGQQAFALAALGRRRESWAMFKKTAKHNPREKRLVVTVPVLLHVLSADRVLHLANKVGRGI